MATKKAYNTASIVQVVAGMIGAFLAMIFVAEVLPAEPEASPVPSGFNVSIFVVMAVGGIGLALVAKLITDRLWPESKIRPQQTKAQDRMQVVSLLGLLAAVLIPAIANRTDLIPWAFALCVVILAAAGFVVERKAKQQTTADTGDSDQTAD